MAEPLIVSDPKVTMGKPVMLFMAELSRAFSVISPGLVRIRHAL